MVHDVRTQLAASGINVSTTFAGSARADMEARGLPAMVRMSVHCTTTPDEISRTLDALREI